MEHANVVFGLFIDGTRHSISIFALDNKAPTFEGTSASLQFVPFELASQFDESNLC